METLFDGYSDWDNANRFTTMWQQHVRYVPEWNCWMCWNGTKWKKDKGSHQVMGLWQMVAQDVFASSKLTNKKAMTQLAQRCASSAGTEAAMRIARSDGRTLSETDDWDQDPWLFNAGNATINLHKDAFGAHAHMSDALITKSSDVIYDPEAECPRFKQFLNEIFEEKQDLIEFVQRIFGLCLTGITKDHAVFILYGTGANGKSTLLNVLGKLLGDYHETAPPAAFFDDKSDNNTNDALAVIRGSRAVICTEPSRNYPLNEAVIKRISGSDKISARYLHADFFTYMPTFKAILAVNHKPTVHGQELGIWRRLKMIPFNVNFVGREDQALTEKLTDELSGILNWAIEGCKAWQEHGLVPPGEVVEATAEYREDMDDLGPWIEEKLWVESNSAPGLVTTTETADSELYASYKEWLGKDGRAPSRQRFSQMLTERGMDSRRAKKGRVRFGVRLKTEDEQTTGEFSWQQPLEEPEEP